LYKLSKENVVTYFLSHLEKKPEEELVDDTFLDNTFFAISCRFHGLQTFQIILSLESFHEIFVIKNVAESLGRVIHKLYSWISLQNGA